MRNQTIVARFGIALVLAAGCAGAKDDVIDRLDRDAAEVEPDAQTNEDGDADLASPDGGEADTALPDDASADGAMDAANDADATDSAMDAANDGSAADGAVDSATDAPDGSIADVNVADASPCPMGILASSTFAVDDEGWRADELMYPSVGSPPSVLAAHVPMFQASGGHPDGHLRLTDPGNNATYWRAPAAFIGDKSSAYGGTLRFDLSVTGNGGNPAGFKQEDVVLVTAGYTLVSDIQFSASPTSTLSWRSVVVPLSPAAWKRNAPTGPAATESELRAALQALTAVYIRGEFLNGLDDVLFLDNAALCAP